MRCGRQCFYFPLANWQQKKKGPNSKFAKLIDVLILLLIKENMI